MSEVLRMEGISKSFGPVQALSDVSLTLHTGEVLALMGENGAGKSTLMNILCGALTNYQGRIYINDEQVHINSPHHARNLGIAKIHQELQLVPELSVSENMFMGRERRNRLGFVDKKGMEKEAQEYLDLLELGIDSSRPVKTLRVGEQQMVEIAKAISLNTRILIMDEPTSAISRAETEQLFNIIRKLSGDGVAIIYITHRLEEVFQISDRIIVIRDGFYVDTLGTKATGRNEIISLMVGREISNVYPKETVPIGEEVLRVEKLSLRPPRGSAHRPLEKISFSLHKGEVLGIGGLLGSGRSELFECIFGVHPGHCSADIYVDGKKTDIRSPREAIAAGISFATEDRKGKGLVLLRSLGENMSLPMLKQLSRFMFMQKQEEMVLWQEQMDSMRIKAPSYNTQCATLSGGNQQKVILGRWMITKPKVLLLDEPTRGIDVGSKAEIYALISTLASQGIGIIVISSDLPEILGITDRIITLCEGRQTGHFLKGEATQETLLHAATSIKEGAE